MGESESFLDEFVQKSVAVSSTVVAAATLAEAADYALRLCSEKDFSRPACSGPHQGGKILAAPDLPEALFTRLAADGQALGLQVIASGLRARMEGIDVGFSVADLGIAETGTAVMRCYGEDARLASMICECHVLALPKSRIVRGLYDAEEFLGQAMAEPMYTAFISGCSRTSDIERVLTLGVHGPLELHIVLIEEQEPCTTPEA